MKKIIIPILCAASMYGSFNIVYIVNNFVYGDKVVFTTNKIKLSLDEAQKLGIKINSNCTYTKVEEIKETYKGGTLFQKKIKEEIISSKFLEQKTISR